MVLKMSIIATILVSALSIADFARITSYSVQEHKSVDEDKNEDFHKSADEYEIDKAFKDRDVSAAVWAMASSADIPATALQSSRSNSLGPNIQPNFNVTVRTQLGASPVADEPRSSFSKILAHMKTANGYNRIMILAAACDSYEFSCEEVIQLANNCWPWLQPYIWKNAVMHFANARNNQGCISDPDNGKSVADSFEKEFPQYTGLVHELKQAFISKKPATPIAPSPVWLQTGSRTVEEMQKVLRDMKELRLIKSHWVRVAREGGLHEPGSPSVVEFERWLKHIRSEGEQFSGPQLVSLVDSIPTNSGTASAISDLLLHLQTYVTGITCAEVKQILSRMIGGDGSFLTGLDTLKPNIIDGQNKVDIIASIDLTYPSMAGEMFVRMAEMVLQDVGVALTPKNNPIFGVVEGYPVILVVDESTAMDKNFTLNGDTSTPRKFCHSQLEAVLERLSDGTYFNVIQYSKSAVKIFHRAVLVNKTSIDAALVAMGNTWRGEYTSGLDPVAMLQNIKVFALKFKQRLERTTTRNSIEALRLAYAMADMPLQQSEEGLHPPLDRGARVLTKGSPQIYFLTSGQPDGGASQIPNNLDLVDNGRNIPVNVIAFDMSADPVATQFSKDLARKSGGFFRSIEKPGLYTNGSNREPTGG